ncbi:HDOD domain-containing protein [Endothiovibrio diazotrophicus]
MGDKTPANVLIVEDEPATRLALSKLLSKRFPGLVVDQAGDGEAASRLIAEKPYRLIVCDWNLPLKRGDQLLEEVRAREEGGDTPFILLTARSDRASVVKALKLGVTSYLTKPFERDQLLEKLAPYVGEIGAMAASVAEVEAKKVEREAAAHGETEKWDVMELIEQIARLLKSGKVEFPTLPDVAMKVSELMRSSETEVDDLVRAIQVDPGISSKLIGVSNSAFYRGNSPNKTLEEAIIRLGMKQTQNVVLMGSTGKLFTSDSPTFNELLTKLWRHALATAVCSKIVGGELSVSQPEVLFTMGLLHDIGKLVVLQLLHTEYHGLSMEEIQQILEALHPTAGAALLKEWRFPIEIVESASFHHDVVHGKFSLLLHIVGFSNLYVRHLGYSLLEPGEDGPAKLAGQCGVNLKPEALAGLEERVREAVGQLSDKL